MASQAQGYEFFDHTADIGIRARGTTLAELFTALARGLTELSVEDSCVQPSEARPVALSAPDVESLVLVWLQELLFWFSTERFLPAEFALDDVSPTALRGQIRGERFDPQRHARGREVKAITRHRLEVRQRGGGWQAQVIVDI